MSAAERTGSRGDAPSKEPWDAPTLAALLERRLGVPVRVTVVVAAVLGLAFVAALVLRPFVGGDERRLVHRTQPSFNLTYSDAVLRRQPPRPGELARLSGARGTLSVSIAVSPLRLRPYAGNTAFALLPTYAERLADALRRRYPGFQLRDEGRARAGDAPGYQIGFQAVRPRLLTFGRELMFVPMEGPAPDAVVVSIRVAKSGARPDEQDQRMIDEGRDAFRSFRFGTEAD